MSDVDFLKLYAETLRLQAQFCSVETRTVLNSLAEFRDAKHILEVGCGPGAQTEILTDLLKGKTYLGIDVVPEFISMAQSRFQKNTSITFSVEDVMILSPSSKYDFVLSFAVLQHLPDTRKALEQYSGFLRSGAVLAIYDSNTKDEFRSHPELPTLREMYRSLSEEQTSGKRKSHCLEQASALAPQLGLKLIFEKQSDHSAPLSATRDLYTQYVSHVADVVAVKYDSKIDRKRFDQELKIWRNDPNSWVTLTGGSWLVLQKNQ